MSAALVAQSTPPQTVTQEAISTVARDRPPFGLSESHISPHHVIITAVGGRLLSLSVRGGSRTPPQTVKRGKVRGFSSKSRMRMMRLFASINQRQLGTCRPLAVTLTYPGNFPTPRASKRHLDTFGKRLKRQYPRAATVWRLELQKRGAPHYHLMVFGVRFIPHQWVARVWREIVKSDDSAHLAAGTEVRRVKSWRHAAGYYAKYMAKKEQIMGDDLEDGISDEDWGRQWGIMGRENMPIELQEQFVEVEDWYQARNVILRYLYEKGIKTKLWYGCQGVTCFTDDLADEFLLWHGD